VREREGERSCETADKKRQGKWWWWAMRCVRLDIFLGTCPLYQAVDRSNGCPRFVISICTASRANVIGSYSPFG